jgi:hypothetical protein
MTVRLSVTSSANCSSARQTLKYSEKQEICLDLNDLVASEPANPTVPVINKSDWGYLTKARTQAAAPQLVLQPVVKAPNQPLNDPSPVSWGNWGRIESEMSRL